MREKLCPTAEGVYAADEYRSAAAVRLENGRIRVITGRGENLPEEVFPLLKGMLRPYRAAARCLKALFMQSECRTSVIVRPWEKKAAGFIGVSPVSFAGGVTMCEVLFISLLCLVFLPALADSAIGSDLVCACLRALFAAAGLYRLFRVRFIRRRSMYLGAINKYLNARDIAPDPGYEEIARSSRAREGTDAAFCAGMVILTVFVSRLSNGYASQAAAAVVRLLLFTVLSGIADEAGRILHVDSLSRLLCRIVTIEPRLEMTELVKVAVRALRDGADGAGGAG